MEGSVIEMMITTTIITITIKTTLTTRTITWATEWRLNQKEGRTVKIILISSKQLFSSKRNLNKKEGATPEIIEQHWDTIRSFFSPCGGIRTNILLTQCNRCMQ